MAELEHGFELMVEIGDVIDLGLTDKYRVFHAPKYTDGQPAEILATFVATSPHGLEITGRMTEVESFVFVLKPNHDHHARVALAAYAASCARDKPQLAKDLKDLLDQDEWGSD